jgi:cytochrome c-type biogenesis protein CcmF
VLLGTLYPLVVDALKLGKISVGPPYFNAVFIPLFAPLLLMVGLAATVSWKRAKAGEVIRHLRAPFIIALIAAVAVPLLIHQRAPVAVIAGGFLGFWAIVTALQEIWRRIRAKTSFVSGLVGVPRGVWGMSLAHLGIGVWALGVTFVSSFSVEKDVRLSPGHSIDLSGYEFRFDGVEPRTGPNYDSDYGTVTIEHSGETVAIVHPEKRLFRATRQMMTEAAVDHTPFRDIYVALGEPLDADGEHTGDWALRLYYKPMMRLVWLGGVLMVLGGLLAATDRRYRLSRAAEARVATNSVVA